jgi:hypothetical protein
LRPAARRLFEVGNPVAAPQFSRSGFP